MADYKILCEVVKIVDDRKTCPGHGKTKAGDAYTLGPRTPDKPMCGRSFCSLHPMALAMRFSEELFFEKEGCMEVVCPDGFVTYRLSRIQK